MKESGKQLYEISYIRPLFIFLLVLMHSFSKIASGGMYKREFVLIDVYNWLVQLIIGFSVETFAFVAGYVFSYQCLNLGKKYEFRPFVEKKFKRLIIPMLFFGIVYYFCFLFNPLDFSFSAFSIKLLSGCGHLWFLSMLFWCFISIWVIDHYKLSSIWTLLLFVLIAIIPIPHIQFGFSRLSHFIFYVYIGYFMWEHKAVVGKYIKYKTIMFCVILYVLLVIIDNYYTPAFGSTIFEKFFSLLCANSIDLLKACFGVLAMYLFFYKFTNKETFQPNPIILEASGICYGVYIFHQFILVYLYHCTPMLKYMGEILTPWIGFVLSLLMSIFLTKISLKTRIGRFLIG